MTDKQTETKTETKQAEPDLPAANFGELKKTFGSKAADIYHSIANATGAGSFGKDFIGADSKPDFPVIDLSGATNEQKEAIRNILKDGAK